MTDPAVERDDASGRFTAEVDGHTAELFFEQPGKRLIVVHTEVPDALEGQGVGGALVRAAAEDAAARGLTLVPRCPFARSWLERHPEIGENQPIQWR